MTLKKNYIHRDNVQMFQYLYFITVHNQITFRYTLFISSDYDVLTLKKNYLHRDKQYCNVPNLLFYYCSKSDNTSNIQCLCFNHDGNFALAILRVDKKLGSIMNIFFVCVCLFKIESYHYVTFEKDITIKRLFQKMDLMGLITTGYSDLKLQVFYFCSTCTFKFHRCMYQVGIKKNAVMPPPEWQWIYS